LKLAQLERLFAGLDDLEEKLESAKTSGQEEAIQSFNEKIQQGTVELINFGYKDSLFFDNRPLLFEIAEYFFKKIDGNCPISIEKIESLYEGAYDESSEPDEFINQTIAKRLLTLNARVMERLDKDGEEYQKRLEDKLVISMACGPDEAQETMNSTYHELCGRTGPAEVEITGEMSQVLILLARQTKRQDAQENKIRQLDEAIRQRDEEIRQQQAELDQLRAALNRTEQPVRPSQSYAVLLPAPRSAGDNTQNQDARLRVDEEKAYIPKSGFSQ
jgi:hypothetical protein